MIKTKGIVFSAYDIPSEWCFRYLLNIETDLDGGDLKILSPLSSEKTPSFSIYKTKQGDYKFKCFSTSNQGNHFELLILLEATKGNVIDINAAKNILLNSYRKNKDQYIVGNRDSNYQPKNGKAFVCDWEMRRWRDEDIRFWNRFEITIDNLEFYNVAPLLKFEMEKLVDGEIRRYYFKHAKMYGFFRKDGSLYTIYVPGHKPKFIRAGNYFHLLGSDQIITPRKNLIYIKSLKDGIAFRNIGFDDYDFKVPPGETIMVPIEYFEADKKIYKKIFVWLDPDKAGNRMAERYKQEYGLDRIDFDLGPKDLSDGIESDGGIMAKIHLMQLL